MYTNNIFIISGPSGVGEDSVIEGLKEFFPIERVITTTTREMRKGESEGNPYHFTSKKDFEKHIQNNDFIEYAKEYNDNYYGVTKQELHRVINSRKIGIWKIEWKGVLRAKELYPTIPSILLAVSDLHTLETRIRKRNPDVTDAYIKERMDYSREWLQNENIYDYTVYNEDGALSETIQEVENIIRQEIK